MKTQTKKPTLNRERNCYYRIYHRQLFQRLRNGVASLVAMTSLMLATVCLADVPGSVTLNGQYIMYNGTPVSPYEAMISYNGERGVAAYLTCLDYNLDTHVGETYTGSWNTNFATFSFADDETSWLLDKYLKNVTPLNANPSIVGPVSFAIWQIQGNLPVNQQDPASQAYIIAASNAVTQGYQADNFIFNPNDKTSQAFMCNPPSPVPEPSTYALFGIGVIGMLMVLRKKTA